MKEQTVKEFNKWVQETSLNEVSLKECDKIITHLISIASTGKSGLLEKPGATSGK